MLRILVLVFIYYISSYGVSDEWFSILLSLVKLFSDLVLVKYDNDGNKEK